MGFDFIIAQQLYGIRIDELQERKQFEKPDKSVIIRLLYQTALGFSVYIMLLLTDVNCDALLTVSIFILSAYVLMWYEV